MSENNGNRFSKNHINLNLLKTDKSFTPPSGFGSNDSDFSNRHDHGRALHNSLQSTFKQLNDIANLVHDEFVQGEIGAYLQIESLKNTNLPDFAWKKEEIRVAAIKSTENNTQIAALFLPKKSQDFLVNKINEYTHEDTYTGKPKNLKKFENILHFEVATISTLWTDLRPIPSGGLDVWWELWIWEENYDDFVHFIKNLKYPIHENGLTFPEFKILPVFGNTSHIEFLLKHTNSIAEIRLADDNPHFFMSDQEDNQVPWQNNILDRVISAPDISPRVCILDNGIARDHPLIEKSLKLTDMHTIDQAWGINDHEAHGHGTGMAGVALYGDLTYPLSDLRTIQLKFKLESVKFIPPQSFQRNQPTSYGPITIAASMLAEISNPINNRVYCMAITNDQVSGEVPSSWSASLDQLISATLPGDDADTSKRLFFVSAGNVPDTSNPEDVIDRSTFNIEDPAQAWNAMTVGGYTNKVQVFEKDYLDWGTTAAVGDTSPYSTFSQQWNQSKTPIKPEIVFEAGNKAISPLKTELISGMDSLSILTTSKDFINQPFTTCWATSPATAQAASLAANIFADNNDYWPETVRALMIHSAEWTPIMSERLRLAKTKSDKVLLLREFGYGVPNLAKALKSSADEVALIAQSYIQPYIQKMKIGKNGKSVRDKGISYNQAQSYKLPIPKSTLRRMGDHIVEMKITLSYFIEPSPGMFASLLPTNYRSHGLRFDLKRSNETLRNFNKRVNASDRNDGVEHIGSENDGWLLGSRSISAGSLHCDIWSGTAASLAERDELIVFPVGGWWYHRRNMEKYNNTARYSLIVTINSNGVDIYTEIKNLVDIQTPTSISI